MQHGCIGEVHDKGAGPTLGLRKKIELYVCSGVVNIMEVINVYKNVVFIYK